MFNSNKSAKIKCTNCIFSLSGELLIPPNANVYYAINTQHDLNFVLRQKNEDLSSVGGNVGEAANSATASDSKRRPQRDTSKARRKLLGLVL